MILVWTGEHVKFRFPSRTRYSGESIAFHPPYHKTAAANPGIHVAGSATHLGQLDAHPSYIPCHFITTEHQLPRRPGIFCLFSLFFFLPHGLVV